jgi:flagellar biosynthesis regulator FlbT
MIGNKTCRPSVYIYGEKSEHKSTRRENDGVRPKMKTLATENISAANEAKTETKYQLFFCPDLDMLVVARTREEAEQKFREDLQMLISMCARYFN